MCVNQRLAERDRSLSADSLLERYRAVRAFSTEICVPLSAEDCVIQSMPDVSPTRWHLAHTTWFFETFVVAPADEDYEPVHPTFGYLFNSYYNLVSEQFPRPRRGLLSRPTVSEVLEYRAAIDERIEELLADRNGRDDGDDDAAELLRVLEIGLQHEQQHQELMFTDIKHVLSVNPLFPAYRETEPRPSGAPEAPQGWISHEEGIRWIGHDGEGFAFDNEKPRHRVFTESFQLARRAVTNAEYLAFINDGGYRRPELWLSAGWQERGDSGWKAPLYWIERDGEWWTFTLRGLRPLCPEEPVCHVSYYEADAFARWSGARLPTEAEWETASERVPIRGNFAESGSPHPEPAPAGGGGPSGMFGDVWEWTASQYTAYPGYRPLEGALGEYNGKFMCNQFVLRGGSCGTPESHIRRTYRNFFPPEARWQFTGMRLAR